MDKPTYVYVEREDYNFLGVKIIGGPFDGLIFHFRHCTVNPPDESGNVKLSFDFNILEQPENISKESLDSVEFSDTLGDILVDILHKTLTDNEYVLTDNIEGRQKELEKAKDEYLNNTE